MLGCAVCSAATQHSSEISYHGIQLDLIVLPKVLLLFKLSFQICSCNIWFLQWRKCKFAWPAKHKINNGAVRARVLRGRWHTRDWYIYKGDGGQSIETGSYGPCGWNAVLECRSRVWASLLIIFPLSCDVLQYHSYSWMFHFLPCLRPTKIKLHMSSIENILLGQL